MSISTITQKAWMFNNDSFNSNPLYLHMSKAPCIAENADDDCRITVVLQNNEAVDTYFNASSVTEIFSASCEVDVTTTHEFECVSGYAVVMECNGSFVGEISEQCPYVHPATVCNSVLGSYAVDGGCELVAFTSTNTTCVCPLLMNSRRHGRNMMQSNDSSAVNVNFVAMGSSVLKEFTSTWATADDLTVASVVKSIHVLVTLLVISIFAVIGATYAASLDYEAQKVVQAVAKKDQRRRNKISIVSRHRRDQFHNDQKLLDSSLPHALRPTPFGQRFWGEIQQHHRWLGVFYHYNKFRPRVLRVVELVSNMNTMLFMQAVLYNATHPADNSCSSYHDEVACVAESSPLNAKQSMCYWDSGDGDTDMDVCVGRDVPTNAKSVMLLAILAAILSTPITFVMDYVIMNVIGAKTVSEMRAAEADTNSKIDNGGARMTRGLSVRNFSSSINRRVSGLLTPTFRGSTTTEEKTLQTSLPQDIIELGKSVKGYRSGLKHFQKNEFDGKRMMLICLFGSYVGKLVFPLLLLYLMLTFL